LNSNGEGGEWKYPPTGKGRAPDNGGKTGAVKGNPPKKKSGENAADTELSGKKELPLKENPSWGGADKKRSQRGETHCCLKPIGVTFQKKGAGKKNIYRMGKHGRHASNGDMQKERIPSKTTKKKQEEKRREMIRQGRGRSPGGAHKRGDPWVQDEKDDD